MYYHCPPRDRWTALLRDELAADEQADLDAHLEGCPDCQRILEDCAANRDVWAGARKLREPSPHDVALRTVMERLKTDPDAEPAVEVANMPDILDPSDQPGSLGRINGYEVLQELGRGGMGIVYKALDPALHRVVAIKVMAPELAVSGSARKRFAREARAAAAVCHEHVVTIHAVEEFKGLPYLVMHYVAGQSVQDKLAKGGPLPVPEILRIGTQVAEGLAAAHKQGIVHRDVKPANILLENGVERVKLTDFSLARAIDDTSVTQSGVITGTPQYMSPEQARGEPVDARSDLFGLGSVLYALCTGRPPFRGNPIEVLRKVADETPKPIREQNPDIPTWLEAIVTKLMAKDPANRFASAAEVASVLGRCLAHVQQPAAVALPSTPEFLPTRRRNWRWVAGVLPILAGLFVVSEATGYTQIVQAVSTILRFKTDEGTLVVEVDDPNVKVTLDEKNLVITGAGPQEVRLKSGWHRFLAMKDGKVLKDELVEVTRDGKPSVRVTFEGVGQAIDTNQHDKDLEGKIKIAEADVERQRDRADWAQRMVKKGYQSEGQAKAEQTKLEGLEANLANLKEARRLVTKDRATQPEAQKPNEKRIRIEFRDKPWAEVLDWFAQVSHLPFVGSVKPAGKFTFVPPKPADRLVQDYQVQQYTLPQIVDILNEALVPQNFLLVRRKNSFTVVPADEKVDRSLLPTVRAEALPTYGKTELVVLMHHLRNANVQELVPEIRKLMGPFGQVIGWTQMGTGGASIILQDTAGNLTRVVEMLKNAEGVAEKPQTRETLVVACKYIKAADAVQKLRDLFAHDRNYSGQMVTFEADERTNNVLISGWSGKVAEAKKVLATLDVPLPSPVPKSPPPGRPECAPQARTFEPRLLWEARVGSGSLDSIAVGRGGRLLVGGETNSEGVLYLLDTASGKTVSQFRPRPDESSSDRHTRALAISPNGKSVLAAVGPRTLVMIEVATGNELFRVTTDNVSAAAYSPDGRVLATAEREVVCLRDAVTGKPSHSHEQRGSTVLAFSSDGSRLAAGGKDRGVVVLEVASGKALDGRRYRGPVSDIAFAPNGRVIVAERDQVLVWTPDGDDDVLRFDAGQQGVHSLAVTARGKHIHTGGVDGTVKVWDMKTGKEVMKVTAPDWQGDVRVFPELPYFLTGGGNQGGKAGETLRLWEITGVQ